MVKVWLVVARRYTTENRDPAKGFVGTEGVPSFLLDHTLQFIVDAEHAKRVACAVIGPNVIDGSVCVNPWEG